MRYENGDVDGCDERISLTSRISWLLANFLDDSEGEIAFEAMQLSVAGMKTDREMEKVDRRSRKLIGHPRVDWCNKSERNGARDRGEGRWVIDTRYASFLVGCTGTRGWERRDVFGGFWRASGEGALQASGQVEKGELEECNMWRDINQHVQPQPRRHALKNSTVTACRPASSMFSSLLLHCLCMP